MSIALVALSLLLSTVPAAPVPAAPPPGDDLEEQDWYGWEILLADGTAALMLGTAAGVAWNASREGATLLVVAGLGIYALGGPIMHGRRDRLGLALADLAVRVALPFAGALVGSLLYYGSSWWTGAFSGALLGPLVAVAIDVVGLAWESSPQAPPRQASLQWTPFVGAARGSPVAGLAGRF